MPEHRGSRAGSKRLPFEIDTSVAHPARVHNYLAGGEDNFAADREAVDDLRDDEVAAARASVRSLRAFMVRTLRYLVEEAGVCQFLKIGTTIPTEKDVHEIVQDSAPESRVVYVGSDPVVLAHAHALPRSKPEGAAAYVHGTLSEPAEILRFAAATLDLTQPVAVVVLANLNFIPDENDPYGIMVQLMKSLAPGSYLALAHTTGDLHQDIAESAERFSESLRRPYVVRSHTDIVRFFDDLTMVDPGLVQIDQWPEKQPIPDLQQVAAIYGGVGFKAPSSTTARPLEHANTKADGLGRRLLMDESEDRTRVAARRYDEDIQFPTYVELDNHLAVLHFVRRKVGVYVESATIKTSDGTIEGPSLSGALDAVEPTEDIKRVHLRLDAHERGDLAVTSVWCRDGPPFAEITIQGSDHAQVVGVAAVIRRFVEKKLPGSSTRELETTNTSLQVGSGEPRNGPRRWTSAPTGDVTTRSSWWRAVGVWFRRQRDDLSVQVIGSVAAGVLMTAISALWLIFV